MNKLKILHEDSFDILLQIQDTDCYKIGNRHFDNDNSIKFIERADNFLYEAKKSGRNNVIAE